MRPVRGRTQGNLQIAVAGSVLGAVLLGLPHRHSMPSWAAVSAVVLGVAVVVLCVGVAVRDFFQRED